MAAWLRAGTADSVLPYFRKAEDNERGAGEFHGSGGPLRVSSQPLWWEIRQAPAEPASGGRHHQSGFQWCAAGRRLLPDDDKRSSSVNFTAAYLCVQHAIKQGNKTPHATRVMIENGRADRVEFRTFPAARPAHHAFNGKVIIRGRLRLPAATAAIRCQPGTALA